jgi:23S rRNA (cytidine1920-2'-O)/16S rRNA (cytidine1409-2'-O)-methyltransferase
MITPAKDRQKPVKMMEKERIDKLLVDIGLADSRTKAHALVMAGVVLVDEKRVDKPSERVSTGALIRIKGDTPEARYVGRGGLKLEGALKEFKIDPVEMKCLDVGASTGGFTDCLLQHGASRVVAVDVGTNQLAWKVRNDDRVTVLENRNARSLTMADLPFSPDLVVMDVSFISVTKILPALKELLSENGKIIVLIKPQFEVGRGEVGKGGIVREPEKHQAVVDSVTEFAASIGLQRLGLMDSPILGAEGNKEFLALFGVSKSNEVR